MKNFLKINTFEQKLRTIWFFTIVIPTISSLFIPTNGDFKLMGKNFGSALGSTVIYGWIFAGITALIWHIITNVTKNSFVKNLTNNEIQKTIAKNTFEQKFTYLMKWSLVKIPIILVTTVIFLANSKNPNWLVWFYLLIINLTLVSAITVLYPISIWQMTEKYSKKNTHINFVKKCAVIIVILLNILVGFLLTIISFF